MKRIRFTLLPLLPLAIVASAALGVDFRCLTTGCTVVAENSDGNNNFAWIDAAGDRVAFITDSDTFNETRINPGIYVYDHSASSYTRCSGTLTGFTRPSISRDGEYVAFYAYDTSSSKMKPFVCTADTGTVTMISASSDVTSMSVSEPPPVLSADDGNGNRYMAFIEIEQSGPKQVLVRNISPFGDATNHVVSRVDSTIANSDCRAPAISDDGTVVAFSTQSNNLGSGGTTRQVHISTYASLSGWDVTDFASKIGSTIGNDHSDDPSISADGNKIAFSSLATNLVSNHSDSYIDIFVKVRGGSPSISLPFGATPPLTAGGDSIHPSISADGRWVACETGNASISPTFNPCDPCIDEEEPPCVAQEWVLKVDRNTSNSIEMVSFRICNISSPTLVGKAGNYPSIANDGGTSFVAFDSSDEEVCDYDVEASFIYDVYRRED